MKSLFGVLFTVLIVIEATTAAPPLGVKLDSKGGANGVKFGSHFKAQGELMGAFPFKLPTIIQPKTVPTVPIVRTTQTTVKPTTLKPTANETTRNIIISFKNSPCQSTLDQFNGLSYTNVADRAAAITFLLQDCAQAALYDLLAQLSSLASQFYAVEVKILWISTQIFVQNAPPPLVTLLTQAFGQIVTIRDEIVAQSPVQVNLQYAPSPPEFTLGCTSIPETPWGVRMVNAVGHGFNGTGITVGSIDTGVIAGHCALKNNFRQENGWLDATTTASLFPVDDEGHGTHTMGTIAGTTGTGIAPGVTWITCRACTITGCTESALLACGQWMLCPTSTPVTMSSILGSAMNLIKNGTTPIPSTRTCGQPPHVVSNSWGWGDASSGAFNPVLSAWGLAGIIPVFASGNWGPNCNSMDAPANSKNVIAVGSIAENGNVSTFSSRGPTPATVGASGVKPDVVAPGESILSAFNGAPNGYIKQAGTSVSAPNAAGVVALLLSKNQNATYDQIYTALSRGCGTLPAVNVSCGNLSVNVYPNNVIGYGLVNAATSLNLLS